MYGYSPNSKNVYLDNFKSWYNIIVSDLFEYMEISDGIFVDNYVVPILNRLKNLYEDVYFVSDCYLPSEVAFKSKLARYFCIRLIATCGNKYLVNMNGDIFVDDRICNLLVTNASRKICKYTPFNYEEARGVEVGMDWLNIGELLGVFVDDIRTTVCEGVQGCCKPIWVQGHL